MSTQTAEIVRELGPFDNIENIGGVTYDGSKIWFAVGDRICSADAKTGEPAEPLDVPAGAGTAFDGKHLYQIGKGSIHKIDLDTRSVILTIPAPSVDDSSGMAWAEGFLWIGQYKGRKILQVDPNTGAILRTIESDRWVTGVTWVDGECWHGIWDDEGSEIRKIDPKSGAVEQRLVMPDDIGVSGLESDGGEYFYCGSGSRKVVNVVKRPQA